MFQRSSRGRPLNAPAAFIHPVSQSSPSRPQVALAGRTNSSMTAIGCKSTSALVGIFQLGRALGEFLGNSKPHPRRIGVYEQLAPGPANSIQKQRQPSPMLESLSLTARQRAMIDNSRRRSYPKPGSQCDATHGSIVTCPYNYAGRSILPYPLA